MLCRVGRIAPKALLICLISCRGGDHGAPASDAAPAAEASSDAAAPRDAGDAGPPEVDASLGDLPADAPFEGRIVAAAGETNPNADPRRLRQTVTLLVRGKQFRWNLFESAARRATEGYRVFDGEQKRFFTVVEATRQVFVVSEPAAAGDAGVGAGWKLTSLATPGKVSGHPCEIMATSDAAFGYDTCVARDLPPFPFPLLGGVFSQTTPFNPALEAQGLFPLYASVYAKPTKPPPKGATPRPHGMVGVTMRFEVITIERFRVNPDLFVLPADYAKTESTHLDLGRPSLR